MDDQESAVAPETVVIDGEDDGEFDEPLTMTKANYQQTLLGIGGRIRILGDKPVFRTAEPKAVGHASQYIKN